MLLPLVDDPGDVGGRVLIVEDSPFFLHVVHRRLQDDLGLTVIDASTMAEAKAVLDREGDRLFLCLLDLVLPDAPHGEVVDLVIERGIPCVVFTGMFSEQTREEVLSKPVIDYVTKDSPASLEYLEGLVRRMFLNARSKAMAVDDSSTARRYIKDLLELYRFEVFEACDGVDALAVLEQNPDIRLIVTDYYMPNMDGFELVRQVRRKYSRSELAIIGLSSGGSGPLSARFIKYGANDFLNKPFLREEFFCRISQNMDSLDFIRELWRTARVDSLTNLHNRRFLFETAGPLLAQARRDDRRPVVAMFDIDHFKHVNDTFGHEAGDRVLAGVADVLRERVRRQSDILARIGGEEFCLLAPDMQTSQARSFFDGLRAVLAETRFDIGGEEPIGITVSIGVCVTPMDTFAEMVRAADEMLYAAKKHGRDRVEIDRPLFPEPG